LIRLDGKWNGEQLIPSELLQECFRPALALPNYGLTFWLIGRGGDADASDAAPATAKARRAIKERKQLGFQPPRDTVAAMGKGKQRCYIISSLDLDVIRLGDSVGHEFSDNEFLDKLLATLPPTSPDSVTREETKNTNQK